MTDLHERPRWAQGWDHLERQAPAEDAKPTRDRKVWVIVALAVALVATLALSIVAAFDAERAFNDVYLRWQLTEQQCSPFTG